MQKILIIGNVDPIAQTLLNLKEFQTVYNPHITQEELDNSKDFDAFIIRGNLKITRNTLENSKLKLIVRWGAGFDNIDLSATREKGIIVQNSPYNITNAVVEFTIAQILLLPKKILEAHADLKEGNWIKHTNTSTEIKGKTLGVIGLGKIGQGVAKVANALGMNTIAFDPFVDAQAMRSMNTTKKELNELFQEADFISVHVPLNKHTENLIDEKEVELMKQGVYIINVSRGKVLNETALHHGLKTGKIAGLAMDTWQEEPHTKKHFLFNHGKVIGTPHIAGSTKEALESIAQETANQTISFFLNNETKNVVNSNF
jgi:D-3-phosphoglycerate dehydrogenase / 2-oxoglutarate reductase